MKSFKGACCCVDQVGHPDVVNLMLGAGASITRCKRDGSSPLLAAAVNGHDQIVAMLLESKASAQEMRSGLSVLESAREAGQHACVRLLEGALCPEIRS